MMTRQEAEAIYDAGKETVVRVLLTMDARIRALEARVQSLENQFRLSRNPAQGWSTVGARWCRYVGISRWAVVVVRRRFASIWYASFHKAFK